MIKKTTIHTLLLLILFFNGCKSSTGISHNKQENRITKALMEKINENRNLQGTIYVIGFEDALKHNVYYAFNKNDNQYYRYDIKYDETQKKFFLAPKTNFSAEVVKQINEIRNNDYTYQEDYCNDCKAIVLYVLNKNKNEETRYQNEKIISKAYLGVYR